MQKLFSALIKILFGAVIMGLLVWSVQVQEEAYKKRHEYHAAAADCRAEVRELYEYDDTVSVADYKQMKLECYDITME